MGSLFAFNPRNTGLFEAQLWRAYYDRNWPRALVLLFRLVRSQFDLSVVDALRAMRLGIQAAIVFAPVEHDDAAVRALLDRFYRVVARATGNTFEPQQVAEAEFNYWDVHRRLAGRPGSQALIDALAAIQTAVYGLSAADGQTAAAERALACDLVDDITGKRVAPTRERWLEIARTLQRSYTHLREAIRQERPPGLAIRR